MGDRKFHIAMYPWFAMGHFNPYLEMANKLAGRGHKISFILPAKTRARLEPSNLHRDLITFIPITIPSVDGLPPGAETTNDVPASLYALLVTAMDLTQPALEAILGGLKPDFVFFDFTYWLPPLARKLDIKSIVYCVVTPVSMGFLLSPERKLHEEISPLANLMKAPKGFPPSKIKLSAHEARGMVAMAVKNDFGGGLTLVERLSTRLRECDAIGFKTCIEIEGAYCDYIERQFVKPVILSGPALPQPSSLVLEERWETLLGSFKPKSLIFCVFGTECILNKDQFQELLSGFELTGLPFLAALKPPTGYDKIESALPEGFSERVEGRGFVHGGWIQQQLILKHPSVGCFVTHCGPASLSEAMVTECQLVLLPNILDQIINARFLAEELKVGVEIERDEEDGLFTRDCVCRAVKAAMDDDSEVGKEIRENHAKWREFLLSPGLEKSYMDGFVWKLHRLLK